MMKLLAKCQKLVDPTSEWCIGLQAYRIKRAREPYWLPNTQMSRILTYMANLSKGQVYVALFSTVHKSNKTKDKRILSQASQSN